MIVHGASEAEFNKGLNDGRLLITKDFIDGAQAMFTKGTRKNKVVEVKATYAKGFAGHRDQAPLWAKRL